MKPVIMAFTAALLTACTQAVGEPEPLDQCGATTLQWLVGKQDFVMIDMRMPEGWRRIRPHTAVTRDYRLDRLNVHMDENGKITQVVCG